MNLGRIIKLLDCDSIAEENDLNIEVQYAFASDLMSDILVNPRPGALLITGLINNQAIRTGKIAGSCAVVFVRNKKPNQGTIELAKDYKMPVLITGLSMFEVCGILSSHGIHGIS